MALSLKCLLHKSSDPSSGPQCPHKGGAQHYASVIPVLAGSGVGEASLARLMSSRFRKKPSFKEEGEEQSRKVPGNNLHTHVRTHMNTYRARESVC